MFVVIFSLAGAYFCGSPGKSQILELCHAVRGNLVTYLADGIFYTYRLRYYYSESCKEASWWQYAGSRASACLSLRASNRVQQGKDNRGCPSLLFWKSQERWRWGQKRKTEYKGRLGFSLLREPRGYVTSRKEDSHCSPFQSKDVFRSLLPLDLLPAGNRNKAFFCFLFYCSC